MPLSLSSPFLWRSLFSFSLLFSVPLCLSLSVFPLSLFLCSLFYWGPCLHTHTHTHQYETPTFQRAGCNTHRDTRSFSLPVCLTDCLSLTGSTSHHRPPHPH